MDDLLAAPMTVSIGKALLHFVWQGTLVGVSVAFALRVLAPSRSTLRYVVACGGLAAMLMAPLVTVVADDAGSARAEAMQRGGLQHDSGVGAMVSSEAAAPFNGDSPASSPIARAIPIAVLIWIAGVLVLSLRLAVAWLAVGRMPASARGVDEAVLLRVRELAERLGIARAVRVLESAAVTVPTVMGWLRPVILLPASALTGLPAALLDAVIAHELAHVRRHDYLVNLAQVVVETLLFYHPAVWWCSRQIRVEREHCCDDLAVEACVDRIAYVKALATLEEQRRQEPALSLAMTDGRLVDRIRRVLAGRPSTQRRSFAWGVTGALVIVFSAVIAGPAFWSSAPALLSAAAANHRDEAVAREAQDLPAPLAAPQQTPATPAVPAPPPPAALPNPPKVAPVSDSEWIDAQRQFEAALETLSREFSKALQDAPWPPAPQIDDIDVAALQRQIEASLDELARETGGIPRAVPASPGPPSVPAPAATPAPPASAAPSSGPPLQASPPALPAPPAAPPPGPPPPASPPWPPGAADLNELVAEAFAAALAQSSPAPPVGDAVPTDAQVDAIRQLADDLASTVRDLQRQSLELRRAEQQLQLRLMELMAAEKGLANVRDRTLAQQAAIDAMRKAVQEAYANGAAFRAIVPEAAKLREQAEALREQIESIRKQ